MLAGCTTTATISRAGGLSFKALPLPALDVSAALDPFRAPRLGGLGGDLHAVAMRMENGVACDDPVRQGETGSHYCSSYAVTGDPRYLVRAEAQADHLIAIHRSVGGAWFYPYGFDYRLSPLYGGVERRPWYSGIGQGAALALFSELYTATHQLRYREAAEHTVASFELTASAGRPWVSTVDSNGYLRLQEYPGTPWDLVLNGHIEAAMGLWECYRATEDTAALELYRGALTTVLRYAEAFRDPGWMSAYSLGERAHYSHYHVHQVWQLLELYVISGDVRFVRLADEYYDDDYPTGAGRALVAAGTYTVDRFKHDGAVSASRVLRVRARSTWLVSGRDRVRGRRGYWLTIAGRGGLDGYSLEEVPGRAVYRGAAAVLPYPVPVTATLTAGTWAFDRSASETALGARGRTTIAAAIPIDVGERAVVDGVPEVLVASGQFAGEWVDRRAVVLP